MIFQMNNQKILSIGFMTDLKINVQYLSGEHMIYYIIQVKKIWKLFSGEIILLFLKDETRNKI